jgi:hypothetical protein
MKILGRNKGMPMPFSFSFNFHFHCLSLLFNSFQFLQLMPWNTWEMPSSSSALEKALKRPTNLGIICLLQSHEMPPSPPSSAFLPLALNFCFPLVEDAKMARRKPTPILVWWISASG